MKRVARSQTPQYHEFRRLSQTIRFYPESLEFHHVEKGKVLSRHRPARHDAWEEWLPRGFSRLSIVLSGRCNMRCSYCYARQAQNNAADPDRAMTFRGIDLVAEQAPGVLEISAVGGEPLLRWDAYCDIVEYTQRVCRERGLEFRTGIITNGLLLNSDRVKVLESLNARVLISIDGGKMRHDAHRRLASGAPSFSLIESNLRGVLRSKARVEALAICARGETRIDEVARDLAELGFRHLGVNLVSTRDEEAQYREEDLAALEEGYERLVQWLCGRDVVFEPFRMIMNAFEAGVLRQYYCNAGIDGLTLEPDGTFTVCPVLAGVPEGVIGHVNRGLDAAAITRFREEIRATAQSGCHDCWARTTCGGGCVSRKHAFTGSLSGEAPLECAHFRMRAEWAMIHHVLQGDCACGTGNEPASAS